MKHIGHSVHLRDGSHVVLDGDRLAGVQPVVREQRLQVPVGPAPDVLRDGGAGRQSTQVAEQRLQRHRRLAEVDMQQGAGARVHAALHERCAEAGDAAAVDGRHATLGHRERPVVVHQAERLVVVRRKGGGEEPAKGVR